MNDSAGFLPEWLVPLEGDTESLYVLEHLRSSDGCSVRRFAKKTVLASALFSGLGAEDVRSLAERLLAALIGAVRLHDASFCAVRVGPLLLRTREGGGPCSVRKPEAGEAKAPCRPLRERLRRVERSNSTFTGEVHG